MPNTYRHVGHEPNPSKAFVCVCVCVEVIDRKYINERRKVLYVKYINKLMTY